MTEKEQIQSDNDLISFYDRPGVQVHTVPVGGGVPYGVERISHPEVGIGGAYGAWGQSYDNQALPAFIEKLIGEPLNDEDKMNLSTLGFVNRHHTPDLTQEEHVELEVTVGAELLRQATAACGWDPSEVEAVMIGMSAPVSEDYVEQIAARAGIPESAVKVSVHKACDGSAGALHMALNPDLEVHQQVGRNLAQELQGKKVLIGGIEGLSRFVKRSRDINALQLFGNGAGVIGVIPGKTMEFIVGKAYEVFDEAGVLAVTMYYPHSGQRQEGRSLIEVIQSAQNRFRIAGLMHEPENGMPVHMAGPMGMVKLFVRNGVQVVKDVVEDYRQRLPESNFRVAIAHHANFKINSLKKAQLEKIGIPLSMPWLLKEFGNVSAASNMIAFLRQLPNLRPGDHILFDGFGAGTYYDVFAFSLGD